MRARRTREKSQQISIERETSWLGMIYGRRSIYRVENELARRRRRCMAVAMLRHRTYGREPKHESPSREEKGDSGSFAITVIYGSRFLLARTLSVRKARSRVAPCCSVLTTRTRIVAFYFSFFFSIASLGEENDEREFTYAN